MIACDEIPLIMSDLTKDLLNIADIVKKFI